MANYVLYDSPERLKELGRFKFLKRSNHGHPTAEEGFRRMVEQFPRLILVEENYGERVIMTGPQAHSCSSQPALAAECTTSFEAAPTISGDENLDGRFAFVRDCLNHTAALIGRSFGYYWPADEGSKNDPPERTMTLHLSHVLLQRDFAVFAEADHLPSRLQSGNTKHVDFLGISPDRQWFLACEFKRVFDKTISEMSEDVDRLASFWLNDKLCPIQCGDGVIETLKQCRCGYGVVGGLYWLKQSAASEIFDYWSGRTFKRASISRLHDKVMEFKGKLLSPMHVRDYPGLGSYYLVSTVFELPQGLLRSA